MLMCYIIWFGRLFPFFLLNCRLKFHIMSPFPLILKQSFHILDGYLTHTSEFKLSTCPHCYVLLSIWHDRDLKIEVKRNNWWITCNYTESTNICYAKKIKIDVNMSWTLFLEVITLSTKKTLFLKKCIFADCERWNI